MVGGGGGSLGVVSGIFLSTGTVDCVGTLRAGCSSGYVSGVGSTKVTDCVGIGVGVDVGLGVGGGGDGRICCRVLTAVAVARDETGVAVGRRGVAVGSGVAVGRLDVLTHSQSTPSKVHLPLQAGLGVGLTRVGIGVFLTLVGTLVGGFAVGLTVGGLGVGFTRVGTAVGRACVGFAVGFALVGVAVGSG